jgi:hypothetical protein
MRAVKKTYKYPLTLTLDVEATGAQVRPMTAADKSSALARLRTLKAADDAKRALDSAKNALEAFVYATRERKDNEGEALEAVTSEEQREALSGIVQTLLITKHMLFVGFSLTDDASHQN